MSIWKKPDPKGKSIKNPNSLIIQGFKNIIKENLIINQANKKLGAKLYNNKAVKEERKKP